MIIYSKLWVGSGRARREVGRAVLDKIEQRKIALHSVTADDGLQSIGTIWKKIMKPTWSLMLQSMS